MVRRTASTAALAVLVAASLAGCSGDSSAQPLDPAVRHIQPGAPGEPNTVLTEAPAEQLVVGSPFSDVDAAFMADMEVHHRQALRMTALVPERAGRQDLQLFAERMHLSQESEVEMLDRWLAEHEDALERAGAGGSHSGGHSGHTGDGDHSDMPGMLTEDELAALEGASGEQFTRLWLQAMGKHHLGALQMVEALLAQEGAAADPRLHRFATDVDSDQRIELDRMGRLWETLPPA